jgi:sulfatase maturation enzyme AslB (radical SAM superfamily)
MDKFVVNIVHDDDLETYQRKLAGDKGSVYEIMRNAKYLQQFVISDNTLYYAKQYEFWSPSSQ